MHTPRWRFTRGSPPEAHNNAIEKPTRAGVRADDIEAKRLEEDCIPRDGGLRGGALHNATQRNATQKKRPEGRF